MDLYLHSPICLHGLALNKLCTGKILHFFPFTLMKHVGKMESFYVKADGTDIKHGI
jgi:hypothetical protein